MSKEELMMPRYKVIADYPNRPLTMPIGHILTLNKLSSSKWWHEYTDAEPLHLEEQTSRNYPAILRKLEWHEERNLSELPLFVKTTYNGTTNKVYKYEFETDTIYVEYPEGICNFSLKAYLSARLPATEVEYLSTLTELEAANK